MTDLMKSYSESPLRIFPQKNFKKGKQLCVLPENTCFLVIKMVTDFGGTPPTSTFNDKIGEEEVRHLGKFPKSPVL